MTMTSEASADHVTDTPPRPGKSISSLLGAPSTTPDRACRLSESPLWDHQRRFYDGDSAGIWGNTIVPHYITGNPRIAHTYTRLALAFLRQASVGYEASGPDTTAADLPHIVELGGGTGRFAYLFVQHLRELAPGLRFVYVLTDFGPQRVAKWPAHPGFRRLIEDGYVDFAVLDADRLAPLELVVSGRRLTPGSLRAPVVGVANYVVDTLRQDAYAIRKGELFDCHLSLRPPDGTPVESDPPVPFLGAEWHTAPSGPIAADLRPVLDHYAETLDDTVVLVPVGGLRCFDFLAALTSTASYMLVADKGHRTLTDLCSQDAPALVPHGEGFSVMVNFDLLARWTKQRGGVALLPKEPTRSLVVAGFVQGDITDVEQLAASFHDELTDIGPDNYFALRPMLSTATGPTIESLLAALRFSRFDPSLFVEFLPAFLELLPTVAEPLKNEVQRVLAKVWSRYFPIGEPIDIALCIGLALSAMAR